MKKEIYIVRTSYYSDTHIEMFADRDSWCDYIDRESRNMLHGTMQAEIYEIEENDSVETDRSRNDTFKKRPSGGTYYSTNESLVFFDSEGEEYTPYPIAEQKISSWMLDECTDPDSENYKKWIADSGEVYDTEEDGIKYEAPSQYMTI